MRSSAKCHMAMETISMMPEQETGQILKLREPQQSSPYADCPVMGRNTSHSITPWLPHTAIHSSYQAGTDALGCEILGWCEGELFNGSANVYTHIERMGGIQLEFFFAS